MINTRHTAEESLNEIRLRMSYNPAKTLNENKCQSIIGIKEIIVIKIRKTLIFFL